ncbi:MAG: sigma-54-dependent Fis family transcriptional regulator [Verrucomicrobia bacterium]|nr:sigma-54-dependent Fis family transcriptional regulator [Verrucomicrobiota bacterium]
MLKGEIFSHAEAVHRLVRKAETDPGQISRLVSSWQRSLDSYGLDPARPTQPRILTYSELRALQDPMERFLTLTKGALQKLYERIGQAGYVILLTDSRGVTVDYLGNDRDEEELKRAGLYLGACWSESEEGTNGPGTCIEDGQPVTIHKTEHFRAPNTTLTCSAAPIFAPDGKMLAVLDASALFSPDDKSSQALVLNLVKDTARLIEQAHFIDVSRDRWLLRLARHPQYLELEADGMLAIEENGLISLATREARDQFQLRPQKTNLVDVFGVSLEELLRRQSGRSAIQLRGANGDLWYVQFRQPNSPPRSGIVHTKRQSTHLEKFAGKDSQLKKVCERARRLIHVELPFVLHGETGCGKERFAHALHLDGPRANKPFVTLNCAAIPESLIESELFGYREGAFTGAKSKGMQGKVILANEGTLFLDEIGDMPLNLQSRLLRVLSEREVLPLGADRPVKVDVRIICASHRDLNAMVHSGQFREDLFYRLSGVVIHLPAIRDREDLSELVEEVLAEEIRATGIDSVLSPDAKKVLTTYAWPGNLREMHHALRYALSLSEGGMIIPDHLPEGLHRTSERSERTDATDQRTRLEAILQRHDWCIESTAKELGVARSTLYRQMDRLRIVPPWRSASRRDG